jgi:LacI family transcriptional regulator
LEKYFIDILRSKGVDGIIFSSVEAKDANIKPLIEDGFPFVLINRRTHHRLLNRKTPYIALNNFSCGWMAMDHLYKMGHRRIGMVTGDFRVSTAIERLEGAQAFFNHVGLELDTRLLIQAHFSMEAAYQAAKRLISLRSPPTAVFAQNDYMALGVREAVMESGLRIPEDMALMGCDNISISGLRGIELTTIGQTKYDMGTLAVGMLVDRIEKAGARKAEQILLEPELIIRKSCGFALYGYQAQRMADRGTCGYFRVSRDRGALRSVTIT